MFNSNNARWLIKVFIVTYSFSTLRKLLLPRYSGHEDECVVEKRLARLGNVVVFSVEDFNDPKIEEACCLNRGMGEVWKVLSFIFATLVSVRVRGAHPVEFFFCC